MDSVIQHVLTVGLGKVKTNNTGQELKSLIINDQTYRYNKDKPFTTTFNNTSSNRNCNETNHI